MTKKLGKKMIPGSEYAGAKIFKWVIDKYGKEFIDKTTSKIWKRYKEVELIESSAKYIKEMRHQYGYMKILGMNEPIELEGIYTRVNIIERPRFDAEKEQNYILIKKCELEDLLIQYAYLKSQKEEILDRPIEYDESNLSLEARIEREEIKKIEEKIKIESAELDKRFNKFFNSISYFYIS
jgi:hypothetical protein